MSEPNEPPELIVLTIEEALDLLSLEDARSSFLKLGLFSGALLIEAPLRLLNRKLGFDDPGEDDEH